jgi:hypothetical protein
MDSIHSLCSSAPAPTRCCFTAQDIGRSAELLIATSWTVPFLRERVAEALSTPIRTLQYKRREIADSDRLDALGLADGAVIVANSPVAAPPRAAGFTAEVIGRRVDQLAEFGFRRADCETALRAAQFNSDWAVDFLLSRQVTERCTEAPENKTV